MNVSMRNVIEMLPGRTCLHYKGGRYFVVMIAETHNHNGDIDVCYVSLTHGKGRTRPAVLDSRNEDAWFDEVEWPDGVKRSRFVIQDHIPESAYINLQALWARL